MLENELDQNEKKQNVQAKINAYQLSNGLSKYGIKSSLKSSMLSSYYPCLNEYTLNSSSIQKEQFQLTNLKSDKKVSLFNNYITNNQTQNSFVQPNDQKQLPLDNQYLQSTLCLSQINLSEEQKKNQLLTQENKQLQTILDTKIQELENIRQTLMETERNATDQEQTIKQQQQQIESFEKRQESNIEIIETSTKLKIKLEEQLLNNEKLQTKVQSLLESNEQLMKINIEQSEVIQKLEKNTVKSKQRKNKLNQKDLMINELKEKCELTEKELDKALIFQLNYSQQQEHSKQQLSNIDNKYLQKIQALVQLNEQLNIILEEKNKEIEVQNDQLQKLQIHMQENSRQNEFSEKYDYQNKIIEKKNKEMEIIQNNFEEQLGKVDNDIESKEKELQIANQQINKLINELDNQTNISESLNCEVQQLRQECACLQSKYEGLENNTDSTFLREKLWSAKKAVDQKQKEIENQQDQLDTLKTAEEQRQALEFEVSHLRTENNKLRGFLEKGQVSYQSTNPYKKIFNESGKKTLNSLGRSFEKSKMASPFLQAFSQVNSTIQNKMIGRGQQVISYY